MPVSPSSGSQSKKRKLEDENTLTDIPVESQMDSHLKTLQCDPSEAYERGLNGRQAAWATRKYRGHRVLPDSIMNDLEKAQIL